jgi:dipeptidase D
VDEETGLTGAHNIASDFLESRTLLNLDSEEEGALYVGCSGGRDTVATWKVRLEEVKAATAALQANVAGLKGGHSGLEIDKGRGNAIKIMGRALAALDAAGARLASVNGGNKHNAIPRECEAVLLVPRQKLEDAEKAIRDVNATIKSELATVEPDLSISLSVLKTKRKIKVLKRAEQKRILQTISALPHGVMKMSADIPGLVETSTNVAVIKTIRDRVKFVTSQRSSVASEIVEIARTVYSIFDLGGAQVETSDGYPGWKPNMDSPILSLARSAYRDLYGKDPEVKAIHAGLECGILGERIPGMDMLSFGPTLEGVHSPDEKIYIDTVEKFWRFLLEILKRAN